MKQRIAESLRAAFPGGGFRTGGFRMSGEKAEYAAALAVTAFFILFGKQMIASPLYAGVALLLVVVILVLFFDTKLGVYIGAAGLVLIEEFDLSSTRAFFEYGHSNSVLAMRILGVSFMDAFTLFFVLPVLIREWTHWRRTGEWRVFPLDRFFLPIIAVYIFGATRGLFNALTMSSFTWEARDIIHIVGWYFIVSRILSTKRDVVVFMSVLLGTFSAKTLLFAYRMAAGQGLFSGYDFFRPAMGADVPFMTIPLIATVAASLICTHLSRGRRMLLFLLAAYWGVWFVQSLGRASYITAVIALAVVFVILWRDMRRREVAYTVGAAAAGGVAYSFLFLSALNRALVGLKFTTAFNWSDAISLYKDISIGQRLLEVVNIAETLSRSGAWLWGLGWGAPWSEIVVKHPVDVSSFQYMEAVRGVHTLAHLDPIYFLLKVGIIGAAILYLSYLRFAAVAIRLVRRERDIWVRLSAVIALAMIIVFVPNYVYHIKLKLFLGMAFGTLSLLAMIDSRNAGREAGGTA
jgi:hypothetical protein